MKGCEANVLNAVTAFWQPLNAQEKSNKYSQQEWALLISTSRRQPRPPNVTWMKYNDFYSCSVLEQEIFKNTSIKKLQRVIAKRRMAAISKIRAITYSIQKWFVGGHVHGNEHQSK